ncbi:MAG: Na/Pi cotransporter family protein [Firmicutes bacterium]|jgi:phosphate:Na+ symporter|nr:Na/Pi cotransporter family protein [Bacillota bacterium]NLL88556.1 Na/Pi cotransporter family protein [Bacillota bacterium]HKM17600.1 Na/Pi cotransporter family protein [Limnochordia bacterium]
MSLEIAFGLIGGLGLFLFGIAKMSEGLQNAAGDRLKRILELFTSRPIIAILTGALATVLIQSSSSTTVMVVGFVNAGLMNLSQAVGTIMGAAIGTTITAQIVAFDIRSFALPLIGIGALMNFMSRKREVQYIGLAVLGLGMLFFGMQIMSESISPLKEYEPFVNMLISFGRNPILGVIAGTIFTVIIQSSSATTSLIIALSLQGLIDIPSGISLIFGANIGTCITAILASLGTNVAAKRAALSHVLFKITGVVIFLILLKPFIYVVTHSGTTVARQLANAHTIFNIVNTIIFYPFVNQYVRLIEWLIPGDVYGPGVKPQYLDRNILHTPAALIAATQEALRMCDISREMLQESFHAFVGADQKLIDSVMLKEETLNHLEKEIIVYLTQAADNPWSHKQHRKITNLLHSVHDVERVGDLSTNIAELAEERIQHNISFSDTALEELNTMYSKVESVYARAIEVLRTERVEDAESLILEDDEIDNLEKLYRKTHIRRLNEGKCHPEAGVLFLDVISTLERIADHGNNLAEAVTGALMATEEAIQ